MPNRHLSPHGASPTTRPRALVLNEYLAQLNAVGGEENRHLALKRHRQIPLLRIQAADTSQPAVQQGDAMVRLRELESHSGPSVEELAYLDELEEELLRLLRSNRKAYTWEALRLVGVPATVLEKAGIDRQQG